MYARLNGSHMCYTFDMRSGYHHIELSIESKAKFAFVTAMGKFECTHVPFRLAEVPTYFQRLRNEVLKGMNFTFGYIDDIMIFIPDIKTHLKHLEIEFWKLRDADLNI